MPLTIPIAHDFICPWCWVGILQARRLQREFGVALEWRGYELFPDELEWGYWKPTEEDPNRPPTLSRFEFLLACEGITMPKSERPKQMRTHNAHEAVEYAKTEGVAEKLVEVLYHAYWEHGAEINDPKVLKKLAKGIIDDRDAMLSAIEKRKFKGEIIGFDDDAHRHGIWNVPTFFIGGKRLAEQPYTVLKEAMEAALQEEGAWTHIYKDLDFPASHEDRPYTYIDMVTTIDGKTVMGGREDSVLDLGSKIDHKLVRRLEAAADAVMIGGQTLRSTPKSWSPKTAKRIVVTRYGRLPEDSAFFKEDAYVASPEGTDFQLPAGAKSLRSGQDSVDFEKLLKQLKEIGVHRLLVLGGSELNAGLLHDDLVDELFMTIAPKVKLGRDVPTYAGGNALPRDQVQNFKLVENHVYESEVFLRYRRERKK